MRVDRIALSGFRNYDEDCAVFDPGINVICGDNAQGKTNLLEAVYIITGAHSFRTRFDRELIAFDSDYASVLADITSQNRELTVQMRFKRGQTRNITVNSVKKKAADMAGLFTVVLFSPDDLYLIKEGAARRRHLMDEAISQLRPGYAALLSDYNRLYENKTRVLKDGRENRALLDTLDVYSAGMAKCGAKIIRYRASFTRRLAEAAARIHGEFSAGREVLDLQYKTVSTVEDVYAPLETIYEQVCRHQLSHRQAEIESGQCLTGIHRDDLEITINGIAARNFASQGQARTAALSLKLGERDIFLAETGEYPVLLLDDVLSELDEKRQSFVLNRIGGGQTLITGCETDGIREKTGGWVLTIESGRIRG